MRFYLYKLKGLKMTVYVLTTQKETTTSVGAYDSIDSMMTGIADALVLQYKHNIKHCGKSFDMFEANRESQRLLLDIMASGGKVVYYPPLDMSFKYAVVGVKTRADFPTVDESFDDLFETLQNQ